MPSPSDYIALAQGGLQAIGGIANAFQGPSGADQRNRQGYDATTRQFYDPNYRPNEYRQLKPSPAQYAAARMAGKSAQWVDQQFAKKYGQQNAQRESDYQAWRNSPIANDTRNMFDARDQIFDIARDAVSDTNPFDAPDMSGFQAFNPSYGSPQRGYPTPRGFQQPVLNGGNPNQMVTGGRPISLQGDGAPSEYNMFAGGDGLNANLENVANQQLGAVPTIDQLRGNLSDRIIAQINENSAARGAFGGSANQNQIARGLADMNLNLFNMQSNLANNALVAGRGVSNDLFNQNRDTYALNFNNSEAYRRNRREEAYAPYQALTQFGSGNPLYNLPQVGGRTR